MVDHDHSVLFFVRTPPNIDWCNAFWKRGLPFADYVVCQIIFCSLMIEGSGWGQERGKRARILASASCILLSFFHPSVSHPFHFLASFCSAFQSVAIMLLGFLLVLALGFSVSFSVDWVLGTALSCGSLLFVLTLLPIIKVRVREIGKKYREKRFDVLFWWVSAFVLFLFSASFALSLLFFICSLFFSFFRVFDTVFWNRHIISWHCHYALLCSCIAYHILSPPRSPVD